MSYDLSIRADERYSQGVAKQPLIAFMTTLPNLRTNGVSGFVLDDPPKRWMEIDLEVVDEGGDNIEEPDQEYPEINCLRLHIPYGFFGEKTFPQDYLPTAVAIARHLKWKLLDEQTGECR